MGHGDVIICDILNKIFHYMYYNHVYIAVTWHRHMHQFFLHIVLLLIYVLFHLRNRQLIGVEHAVV